MFDESNTQVSPWIEAKPSKRKISPIKNCVVQLDERSIESHLIKRTRGRVWNLNPNSDDNKNVNLAQKTLRRAIFDLKSQRKMQKVSISW